MGDLKHLYKRWAVEVLQPSDVFYASPHAWFLLLCDLTWLLLKVLGEEVELPVGGDDDFGTNLDVVLSTLMLRHESIGCS